MNHERVIVHIDIDCFYAQVEMIRNPSLKDKPIGIQQKYLLVTCNYEARKRGVSKLMSLVEAKRKCPDIVVVNGEDLTNYRQMSYQISEYIQRYTQCVERLGFDENFVDVTEMVKTRLRQGKFEKHFIGHVYDAKDTMQDSLLNPPCVCGCNLQLQIGSQIAADIREGLEHDLNITCCAGIAHNKLLAKLVGSINKPNQQTTMLPHLACMLMSSLAGVRAIPGIGSRTTKRLNSLEIHSVSDLRQTPLSLLEQEFGSLMGPLLLKLAVGIDEAPVVTFGLPQTLSDEDSFKCCNQISDVRSRIEALVGSLLERLREDGRIPHTLRLTIRRTNYHRESRQCSVQEALFTKFYKTGDSEIASKHLLPKLMNLFSKMVNDRESFHLTLINVCFAKLIKPAQNKLSSFFNQQNPKCVKIVMENKDISVNKNEIRRNSLDSKETRSALSGTPFSSPATIFESVSSPETASNQEMVEGMNENQDKVPECTDSDKYINKACLDSLQHLLPFHLDARTILELPDCIQDEILSQHGIHSECSTSGDKVYVLKQDKISTRSTISNTRKPLFSPKKKGQKRYGEHSAGNSKKQVHLAKETTDMFCVETRCEEGHPNNNAERENYIVTISKNCDQVDSDNDIDNAQPLNREKLNGIITFPAAIDSSGTCFGNDVVFKTGKDTEKKAKNDEFQIDSGRSETLSLNASCSQLVLPVESELSFKSSNSCTSDSKSLLKAPCESQREVQGAPDLSDSNGVNQSFCPQGIDPEVFAALPTNIRGEIMAHTVMGTGDAFLTNRMPTITSPCETKKKGQKTLLDFFHKT